jgi:hypothetical protein
MECWNKLELEQNYRQQNNRLQAALVTGRVSNGNN